MDNINLALVLLASFWAGTNAIISGLRFSGEVLEKIVGGKSGDQLLDGEYRHCLYLFTWLPLRIALALVAASVGLIIFTLPQLAGDSPPPPPVFKHLCYGLSVVPFLTVIIIIVSGLFERSFIRGVFSGQEYEGPALPPGEEGQKSQIDEEEVANVEDE